MRRQVIQREGKEEATKAPTRPRTSPDVSAREPGGPVASLLDLQRAYGNRFVQRLMRFPSPAPGPTIQRDCSDDREPCASMLIDPKKAHPNDVIFDKLITLAGTNDPGSDTAREILKNLATLFTKVDQGPYGSTNVSLSKTNLFNFLSNYNLSEQAKARVSEALTTHMPRSNPVIADERGVGTRQGLAARDQEARIQNFLAISTGTGHLFAGLAAAFGADTARIKAFSQLGDIIESAAMLGSAAAWNRPTSADSTSKASPSLVQGRTRFRGALSFELAEIKSVTPSSAAEGLKKISEEYSRRLQPGQAYSLITYDAEGNLFMRQFIVSGNPLINDLEVFRGQVGKLAPENMPKNAKFGESSFGNQMETAIRQYMRGVTGDVYEPKSPSASGEDLTRIGSSKESKTKFNLLKPRAQPLLRTGAIQPKLTISEPGDQYEQEADQVAEQVMRMPGPGLTISSNGPTVSVQKKSAACASGEGACPQCVAEDGNIYASSAITRRIENTKGQGESLPESVQHELGSKMGADFSSVRIHTDSNAIQLNRDLAAHAFTHGKDIYFNAGKYNPETVAGKYLLAHELTHVLQQQPSEAVSDQQTTSLQRYPLFLQRSPEKDRCSGAGAVCAPADQCALADPGSEGNSQKSTGWKLHVHIDVERDSWEEALRKQEFGHTHVRFLESNGQEYTYGFYPASELPNEKKRTVPGCVHHPDTTHDNCIDDTVSYALTEEQYKAALAAAQNVCRSRRAYGVDYTCTTYADEVVRAAGQSIPSSRSDPTSIYYQQVPSIDNPNTLRERVREERQRDPSKRQPYWNKETGPAGSQTTFLAEIVKEIIGMIHSQQDRSVFSRLNGMWMVVMLEALTELNKRKYLDHLFDFFAVAQDVNRPRLMAAMRAVRLKASTLRPTSEQIAEILALAPDFPEQQKNEITAYLNQ